MFEQMKRHKTYKKVFQQPGCGNRAKIRRMERHLENPRHNLNDRAAHKQLQKLIDQEDRFLERMRIR